MSYHVKSSEALACTNGASAPTGVFAHASQVRLVSDKKFHFKVNAAATITDTYVPVATVEFIDVPEGATLNIILGTGETAGPVNIAKINQS